MAPELSRPIRIDTIGSAARGVDVHADEGERTALARRFGLVAIDRLEAEVDLLRDGADVVARGRLRAAVQQACVVTDEPVAEVIDEAFVVHFRPEPAVGDDEEVELDAGELDVIFYDGASIDIGEAAAQTLALNLDPYPRAAGSDAALAQAGVQEESAAAFDPEPSPFDALKSLRDKLGG